MTRAWMMSLCMMRFTSHLRLLCAHWMMTLLSRHRPADQQALPQQSRLVRPVQLPRVRRKHRKELAEQLGLWPTLL